MDRSQPLWDLVFGSCDIDPLMLSAAVAVAKTGSRDARTRFLIEESEAALSGALKLKHFPSLPERIRQVTRPETIRQFLREIGLELQESTQVVVGESSALILLGLLQRATEDVDVVDEVPAPLRAITGLRERTQNRYGLHLAHFQSHYLPPGWRERLSSEGDFCRLRVYVVDPIDIFVGKVFSRREKDLDDLRSLSGSLTRELVVERLRQSRHAWTLPSEQAAAERNRYIVFGEALPV
jgi:hypothetical protein